MRQALAQRSERGPGDDRDDELAVVELSRELARHRWQHLRLHRQDDNVRVLRGLDVRSERLHAVGFRELGTPLAAGSGDEHVGRRHEVLVEQTADHRFSHGAAADERETLTGKRHARSMRSARNVEKPLARFTTLCYTSRFAPTREGRKRRLRPDRQHDVRSRGYHVLSRRFHGAAWPRAPPVAFLCPGPKRGEEETNVRP